MQNELLKRFNADFHTREEVLSYIVEHLEGRIVEEAVKGNPVDAIARAINEINLAFDNLRESYDTKQTTGGGGVGNSAK